MKPRTILLTLLALCGFAGNSLFTRAALRAGLADPANFSLMRTLAGALTLAALVLATGRRWPRLRRDHLKTAVFLYGYMIFFSFAYISIPVAAGSLIAFGAVQLTMLTAGYRQGDRMSALGWTGFFVAVGGIVYLVSPGMSAPPLAGAALMVVAGATWGGYSVVGRSHTDPLADTAINFLLAVPLALVVAVIFSGQSIWTGRGVALACGAGVLSSGVGYMIWYAALRDLRSTQASIVQLGAPIIAAAGSALLLAETPPSRIYVAGASVLGGVAVALLQSRKHPVAVPE